ncbi:MAG: phospho-N-acetylmuramoyl-pentapeptide-transferase [bacterium]
MFYWLYELWQTLPDDVKVHFSPFRVLNYITVRAFCGAGTAFLLSVLLGPWVIRQLVKFKARQVVRKQNGPAHGHKEGTPTMGGILIVVSIMVSTLLWAVPGNRYVFLVLATLCFMAAVGFWDDYAKIARQESKGLTARRKLLLEILWAATVFAVLVCLPETRDNTLKLMVPFCKYPVIPDMGYLMAFVFLALIIVGSSNAVNLTDGLDGLAIGCSGSVALSYLLMAYAAGHVMLSDYLLIPYVPGAGELAVFCGCMLGACLGFLWYNCHPAKVFMGDTGSLALGGAIAMVAILIKQELVLIVVGGVFVIEALSVIIQVTSFKLTGKRVFAMTPIHHHFEKKGWSETQITVRFWIVSIILALVGILILKIR